MRTIAFMFILICVPVLSQQLLCEFVSEYHVTFFSDDSKTSNIVLNSLEDLRSEFQQTNVKLVVENKNLLKNREEHESYKKNATSKGIVLSIPYLVTEEGGIIIAGGYKTDEYLIKALILQMVIERSCKLPAGASIYFNQSKSYLKGYENYNIYDLRDAYDYTDAKMAHQLLSVAYSYIVLTEKYQRESMLKIQREKEKQLIKTANFDNIEAILQIPEKEFKEGEEIAVALKLENKGKKQRDNRYIKIRFIIADLFGNEMNCLVPLDNNEFESNLLIEEKEYYLVRFRLNKPGSFKVIAIINSDGKEINLERNIIVDSVYNNLRDQILLNISKANDEILLLERLGHDTITIKTAFDRAETNVIQANQLYSECDLESAIKKLEEAKKDLSTSGYKINLLKDKGPIYERRSWIIVYGKNAPLNDKNLAFKLAEKTEGKAVSDYNTSFYEFEEENVVLIGGPAINHFSNIFKEETDPRFIFIDGNWYILSEKTLINDETFGFFSKVGSPLTKEMYIVAGLSRWGTEQGYNKFIDFFDRKEEVK